MNSKTSQQSNENFAHQTQFSLRLLNHLKFSNFYDKNDPIAPTTSRIARR
jgi:hypothetical protein